IAGLTVPTLASLLYVPMYLQAIGETRYGVLLLVLTLLGYFTAFDLGLGQAISRRIANTEDIAERNRAFWTALGLSACTGLAGGIAVLLLGHGLFPYIFDLPAALYAETSDSLPWIAAMVPLASMSSVVAGALQGRQA